MKIALMRSQEAENDPYCECLQQLGTVCCIPVLSFNFINLTELYKYLASPDQWGGIIFTSKRAVEACRLVVTGHGLPLVWKNKVCFVVGDATSKVAAELGFECVGSECGNADKLTVVIKSSYSSTLPLLFVCGNLRRDTLPAFLQTNNICYKCITVYETVASVDIKEEIHKFVRAFGTPSHIVYFSPSGYRFAQQIWKEELTNSANTVRLVAIGATTATEMKDAVLVAKKPNPISLYEVIKDSNIT